MSYDLAFWSILGFATIYTILLFHLLSCHGRLFRLGQWAAPGCLPMFVDMVLSHSHTPYSSGVTAYVGTRVYDFVICYLIMRIPAYFDFYLSI